MNSPTALRDRKILVVGFGKTGKAVTRFLLHRKAHVTVTEIRPRDSIGNEVVPFEKDGAAIIAGSHPPELFLGPDLIVLSPGVDPDLKPLVGARQKGIPIISEIELASRFIGSPIIGITGTNGKSTTTALIASILSGSGFSVFMGGNIGTPLIDYVHDGLQADFVVVELSSFQLETIETLTPRIAILLNITEDHLDRYSSFDHYRNAKRRIFMNQTEKDFALINVDDPASRPIIPSLSAQVVPFSSQKVQGKGMYANGDTLYYRNEKGATHAYRLSNVKLMGAHNRENMLAAIGAAELCGCDQESIQKSLENFRGLEHRLEYVREIDGVLFYNDSKATNIDALLRSLQSFPDNVILIAGGREKGGDYGVLKEEIHNKVRMLILIGESREKLFQLFGTCTPTRFAQDLKDALRVAFQHANRGDVILLAPGCASFDMFSSYAERGQRFKQAVEQLAHEREQRN